jgi:hypothetical protein
VASFEYATLVFAIGLGFVVWSEFPAPIELAGIIVVVCSNLFLVAREQLADKCRSGLRLVVPDAEPAYGGLQNENGRPWRRSRGDFTP